MEEQGRGVTDTRERLFGRKVPGTCGQPENQRNRVPLLTRVRHRDCAPAAQTAATRGPGQLPKTAGGGPAPHGSDQPRHQSRRRAPVLQSAGATPRSDSSRSLHEPRPRRQSATSLSISIICATTRHDVDRRIFPARSGGIPCRSAGDVGTGMRRLTLRVDLDAPQLQSNLG